VKLAWSRLADGDLVAIWQAIAIDSEKAADRMLDRLQGRAEALIEFPKMGQLRKGRQKDIGQLVEGLARTSRQARSQ
jgi:plasmid stabilization system protein ParE